MRTAVIASVVGILFILKAAGMLVPAAHGMPRFIDDAYYYLIIARNFAYSGIPSFDGLHATNGFHPLWMLLLAAMYRLIGRDADLFTQIAAAKALEACVLGLALAACVFAFHRLRAKTPLAWGFLGAALIFFVPGFFLWEQGMESTLAAALLIVSLYAMLDDKPRWLAASLPLLFLARLDTLVFVIAPMAVAWLYPLPGPLPRERENFGGPPPREREKFVPFIPLAIVVAIYVGMNVALTGHATPISGQIKSSFPLVTPHLYFLWMPLEMVHVTGWDAIYAAPNVLAVTLIMAILAIACARAWKEPWSRPVALVLAIAALLVANILLFQRWNKGVEPRYLALPYLLLGFAAFATFAGVLSRNPRAARPAALAPGLLFVALAAACGIAIGMRLAVERGQRIDRRTHFEVMSKVAPNERLAGTDVGGFSFWLQRSFVNLDGLVNNRELQDAIRDRRLAGYLERSDVRYLLVAFWDSPQAYAPTDKMYLSRIFPAGVAGPAYDHYDFSIYSYVHDAYSDPIRLYPGDEIFREAIGRDGTANAAIVIYRLRRPLAAASVDRREIRREPFPRAS
jgi:hypothetical protein